MYYFYKLTNLPGGYSHLKSLLFIGEKQIIDKNEIIEGIVIKNDSFKMKDYIKCDYFDHFTNSMYSEYHSVKPIKIKRNELIKTKYLINAGHIEQMYLLCKTDKNKIIKVHCCDNFPTFIKDKFVLEYHGLVEVIEIKEYAQNDTINNFIYMEDILVMSFICPICKKDFKNKISEFNSHLQFDHEGEAKHLLNLLDYWISDQEEDIDLPPELDDDYDPPPEE